MGFDIGYGNQSSSQPQEQNNHFKEVDLIGNPAISLFTAERNVFLPSQAQPFMPYYISLVDAYVWRSPLMEMMLYPLYIIPGVHVVGSLIDNWGSVYPRTGFIDQPADAKAGAVIAQRAAEIATRGLQPHVYNPLNITNFCGDHCDTWEAKENDPNTQWQFIYPTQQNTCMVFGVNDMTSPQPWEQDAVVKGDGNYAWIMWRHYKGCIPGDGTYIGSIDF
jgi:integrating conjugative element protein (TIGR03756 family)